MTAVRVVLTHEADSEGPGMVDLPELDSSACKFFTSREGLDIMQVSESQLQ